jgi:hypothetical protein
MKNILIVESANDKFFIQAMIQNLQIENTEVAETFLVEIDDFEEMDGMNPEKLKLALRNIQSRARKEEIGKIGIILDIDDKTKEKRISLVNDAISDVFKKENTLSSINSFSNISIDKNTEAQIGCYFTNVNGEGELETLLKAIKSANSPYADCLESWQQCLEDCQVKPLKKKDFDKFWVNIYIRYDTCSKSDAKQAGRKCNNEASMLKPIWNFQHEYLNELTDFLRMFNR